MSKTYISGVNEEKDLLVSVKQDVRDEGSGYYVDLEFCNENLVGRNHDKPCVFFAEDRDVAESYFNNFLLFYNADTVLAMMQQ